MLLDPSGSLTLLLTVAVFVIVPVRLGIAWIATVLLAPGANVSRSHSTAPPVSAHPADALANVTLADRLSRARAARGAIRDVSDRSVPGLAVVHVDVVEQVSPVNRLSACVPSRLTSPSALTALSRRRTHVGRAA